MIHFFYSIFLLVGGFNPSEKYESQLGVLFPIYGKKHLPNHQPVFIFPNLFPSISSTNPNFSTDSTVHLPALAAVSGDTEEARLMELVAVGGLIWQDEPAVEKG